MPNYEHVRLLRWIHTFKNEQSVDIIIKKHRNKRTDPQNNYYFGVVVYMLSQELGYTKDEMHSALKIKFASKTNTSTHFSGVDVGTKDELTIVESTAKMNTERFGEYIEEIKRWAAEYLSLYLPDPNEVE